MTGSASGGEEARRLKSTLLDRPGEFRWREVAFGRLFAAAGPCTGSNRPAAVSWPLFERHISLESGHCD